MTAARSSAFGGDEESGSGNELYDQAVALVCRERKASTSFVQRHLQIGYNRAAQHHRAHGSRRRRQRRQPCRQARGAGPAAAMTAIPRDLKRL